MGKSAKLHKRLKKTASSHSKPLPTANPSQTQVQTAKKKATQKQKAGKSAGGHVLGGADYVDIMMGSRKRAREEATKLPASEA